METALLLVLCAPLPWGVRKTVSRWIFKIRAYDRIQTIMNYILFALCLAVVESLNELRSVYTKLLKPSNTTDSNGQSVDGADSTTETPVDDHYNFEKGYLNWQKVRAERNCYLAAFTVTAFLAIIRLVRLATIEMHLRDKIKEFNGDKDITELGDIVEAEVAKKES